MQGPDNANRDWSFDVNLSGLNAPTGATTSLPEGFYKVKISDMYVGEKPGRVIIKAQITEGQFTGVLRTDGLNIPKDENDNVRYYWRAIAESAGYTPAQLDAGQVNLKADSFIGREAYIKFVPKNEAAGRQFERINWLSSTEWSQQKQGFEAAGTDTTTETAPAGSSLSGGNTVAKKDVVAQLGLG